MKKLILLTAILMPLFVGCAQTTPRKDLGIERIVESLNKLLNDDELQSYAPDAMDRARFSVKKLQAASSDKERAHLAYTAQIQIELARAKARTQWARAKEQGYKQDQSKFLLQIKSAEADIARYEAQQALLQSQAAQEETERMRNEMNRANMNKAQADKKAEQALREAEQARRLANAQKREAQLARQEADAARNALQDAQNRLRDLEAKQTERGVVLTLGDVLFASGESSLRDSALEEIKTLAQFLQEYPDQDVRVEGHTDSRGKASLNQTISQKRAEAVMDALVGFGVKESRLLAVGYGESRPVAGNETEQDRAKNRRVEVVLLDEK